MRERGSWLAHGSPCMEILLANDDRRVAWMKLHCLGTAGYHPSETRHTSCYALPECDLVLDAGSGFFRLAPLITRPDLHILLSHTHLDHVFGLTFVLDLLPTTPLERIHVYAQRKKIEALCSHLFHEDLFPVMPPIEWHALEDLGTEFSIGETQVAWFPLQHPGGSVGYRLDWNSTSLAYVTDTTSREDAEYWGHIQGVEWLLHECNFSDRYRELAIRTGHSWTSAVLENAAHAKIRRLLLSHFNPLETGIDPIELDAATAKNLKRTPEQILLASDLLIVDLARL